jgi:diguanylate cyclase (GGDEF)-like protein
MYPALALGLALLVRHRAVPRDWGTRLDAAVVTVGLGLLAWIFLAHPLGAVLLAGLAVRLLFGTATRTPVCWLAGAAAVAFLPGDATGFLVGFVLFGTAALHPSARQAPAGDERRRTTRPTNGRIALLTAASLVAPVVLLVQVVQHRVTDGLAIAVGSMALILLVVARMVGLLRQLERQTARIRELSHTDELTGLPNRRAWTGALSRAIEQARRNRVALSVALLDLDHFKAFNDTYGHPAGDRLIKTAGALWYERLRAGDYLARYGGEEFLVLLPDADGTLGRQVIDRLRDVTPLGQTFSAGVATWDGTETSDELVARADAALYEAKQAGRNRIVLAARTPSRSLILS